MKSTLLPTLGVICCLCIVATICSTGDRRWRIINGMVPKPYSFPSFVSIQRGGRHFCGGTLINRDTVLTAAHCFFRDNVNSLPSISVVAGEHDFKVNSGHEVRSKVRTLHIHPNYKTEMSWRTGSDIAIFKLQTPIAERPPYIKYAVLQEEDSSLAGIVSSIIGFGSIDTATHRSPTLLQEAKLMIITNAECARRWPAVGQSNNANICLSNGGKQMGVCFGDSGGPAYIVNAQGVQVQVGIASYTSKPCSMPGFHGVYTRVSTYMRWIRFYLAQTSS